MTSVIRGRRTQLHPPQQEFLVLDADSSQQWAINTALQGKTWSLRGHLAQGKANNCQPVASYIAVGKAFCLLRRNEPQRCRRSGSTTLNKVASSICAPQGFEEGLLSHSCQPSKKSNQFPKRTSAHNNWNSGKFAKSWLTEVLPSRPSRSPGTAPT